MFAVVSQGVHVGGSGAAAGVARPGHQPTSGAADIVRRRVLVHFSGVPFLITPVTGEFFSFFLTFNDSAGWLYLQLRC